MYSLIFIDDDDVNYQHLHNINKTSGRNHPVLIYTRGDTCNQSEFTCVLYPGKYDATYKYRKGRAI